MKLDYKLLIYDIETGKVKYRSFSGGESVLRHAQLCSHNRQNPIICISAKWFGESKITTFVGEDAIEQFLKMVDQADAIIGKNNKRFDDKHVNTQRLLQGLSAHTRLEDISDDLESQLRKYFTFQSYSLDHVANLLLGTGKDKMEDSDWNNIQDLEELTAVLPTIKDPNSYCQTMYRKSYSNVLKDGKRALKKMVKYNKTDVVRTEQVLLKVLPYIKLKKNAAANKPKDTLCCTTCGSKNIHPLLLENRKNKIYTKGKSQYLVLYCEAHKGIAGARKFTYSLYGNKKFSGGII